MIHNLSDHILTEDEFSVLTEDLFFTTPIKTFKQEINKSGSKLKTHVLKQHLQITCRATCIQSI